MRNPGAFLLASCVLSVLLKACRTLDAAAIKLYGFSVKDTPEASCPKLGLSEICQKLRHYIIGIMRLEKLGSADTNGMHGIASRLCELHMNYRSYFFTSERFLVHFKAEEEGILCVFRPATTRKSTKNTKNTGC